MGDLFLIKKSGCPRGDATVKGAPTPKLEKWNRDPLDPTWGVGGTPWEQGRRHSLGARSGFTLRSEEQTRNLDIPTPGLISNTLPDLGGCRFWYTFGWWWRGNAAPPAAKSIPKSSFDREKSMCQNLK